MTYSLGLTGLRADTPFTTEKLDISDSDAAGNALPPSGLPNYSMRLGTQVLCKQPDGSQKWFTIDAERSTAAQIVLKAV